MNQRSVFLYSHILLLLVVSGCRSTNSNRPLPPPSAKDFHDNQQCYHNGHLNAAARSNIFPFSKAHKIVVVSFDSKWGHTPIANDTICHAKTKETVVLSTADINRLTDVLYNYNYSKKTNVFTDITTGCYYPRHAIIFLDNTDKVISFLEICLECQQLKTNLPRENTGPFCEGKYRLLKEFFVSIGIKHYKD